MRHHICPHIYIYSDLCRSRSFNIQRLKVLNVKGSRLGLRVKGWGWGWVFLTVWDVVQDEMLLGILPKFEEGPFISRNIYLKWKDPIALKFNPFAMWLIFSSSYFTWNEIVKLAIIVSCNGFEVWKAFNEKQ